LQRREAGLRHSSIEYSVFSEMICTGQCLSPAIGGRPIQAVNTLGGAARGRWLAAGHRPSDEHSTHFELIIKALEISYTVV
jgi:hypothetical protein